MITCPCCHVVLPNGHIDPPCRFNASGEYWQAFSDLTCYTIAKQDPAFIHQHAVDAYEAQHGGGNTRPITMIFALTGLCLALEKGHRQGSAGSPYEDRTGLQGLAITGTTWTTGEADRNGRSAG